MLFGSQCNLALKYYNFIVNFGSQIFIVFIRVCNLYFYERRVNNVNVVCLFLKHNRILMMSTQWLTTNAVLGSVVSSKKCQVVTQK